MLRICVIINPVSARVSGTAPPACVAPAYAGGPFMMVGAAEDVGKSPDYAFAKTEMDNAKFAGFDTIRLTKTWTKA